MDRRPGECVTSDTITVATDEEDSYDFCVKLYPRGGGHPSQHTVFGGEKKEKKKKRKQRGGFGMSYRVLPMFGERRDEKVGVYLQFLPKTPDQTVDASFALRLLGKQKEGRRFDVEWKAGMRFVSLESSKLAEGRANDFGAHLMFTPLLREFLGVDDDSTADNKNALQMQVEINLHSPPPTTTQRINGESPSTTEKKSGESGLFYVLPLPLPRDIRAGEGGDGEEEPVRVGRVVVPVLSSLSQRPGMMARGTYPGVEYRILRMVDPGAERDVFYYRPGVDMELKPIYPLVAQLERPWPVRVNEKQIPRLLTRNMYNAVSAVGSLFTAVTGLAVAFLISQAVSLFYIPSRSMDPTLERGDVLLVEKVSPKLFKKSYRTGDVVLFSPPSQLRDIVSRSGGRLASRDLFVKRVAAEPGDEFVVVDKTGSVRINDEVPTGQRDLCTAEPLRMIEKYMPSREQVTYVPPGSVMVLGDCSSVSIDSRVWGPLPTENIVGRPIARLWPLTKFGPVPSLPTAEATWKE
jgi:signal peptidase I